MSTKRIVAVVGTVLALLGVGAAALAAGVFGLLAYLTGVAEDAYLNTCVNDQVATGPAYAGKKFPTQEEMAGILYSQMVGAGLGELGALAAISAGLAEASLHNGIKGDRVTTNASQFKIGNKMATPGMMTDSRGVFQQRMSWVPKNLAWSGQSFTYEESERLFADRNALTGEPFAWNPWKGTGWGISDPRMNPPLAALTFAFGGAGGQPGLEEAFAKHARIGKTGAVPAPETFTDVAVGELVQQVQRSAPNKYASRMPEARALLSKIRAGEIAVPAFTPPAQWQAPLASTARVKASIRLAGAPSTDVTQPAEPTTEFPVLQGDGVTLIGDSVMKHTAAAVKLPDALFGGSVIHHSMVGISLGGVLSGKAVRASDGSRDPQGRKATPTSEWIRDIAEGPSRIIVQLGTNGGGTRQQVDQFMNLAGPNRSVFWFSQHYGPSQPFNDILLDAAGDYPNLTVVDISSTPGLDVTSKAYHPWEGVPAKSDPTKIMWATMMRAVAGGGEPNIITSLACGGLGVFVGDIQAPTVEAANAVLWALKKEREGTGYVLGAGVGDSDARAYDCSSFTYTAYAQAGYQWTYRTSSAQWADEAHVQLIPIAEAAAGDLLFSNWGGGDMGVAGHVSLIVGFDDQGVPQAVGAENPTSGVTKYSLADYRPSTGYLGLRDPNGGREASNVVYSQDWRSAWVGRIVGGSAMASARTSLAAQPAVEPSVR